MFRNLLLGFTLFIAVGSNGQAPAFAKRFPLVDKFFDSLMKEWNIPGLALGIVYNDQLVYNKGYGYRDLENKLAIDQKTLFPIASNTKLFTATAACMLAEEKKLSLDKPVTTYVPSLKFYNDELNAKITLRDMLSHRTGLPRYDGIWVNASFKRKELVEKISYMKPQLGFREGYIYNNMMFATAGAIMETVTGMSWEDLLRQKLFEPLQMTNSCFTTAEMKSYGNYSLSYFTDDSTQQLKTRQFEAQSEALGPAGTIKSSVEDMSHWMMAQLNNGLYKGKQVIPTAAMNQTLLANSIGEREVQWEELSNSLYGLGRSIYTYKGVKITSHTGSIDGFYSQLLFVPSQKIGVFVVFNATEAGSLRSVVCYSVLDRLLGLDQTPWSKRYRTDYLEGKARTKRSEDSIKATRVANTQPSHPLQAYTGVYMHPVYGDIKIDVDNNQLVYGFRSQRSILNHFHYDQFVNEEKGTDKPAIRLQFSTGNNGAIEKISCSPLGDPLTDFIKKK